jgi:hypothetical protein
MVDKTVLTLRGRVSQLSKSEITLLTLSTSHWYQLHTEGRRTLKLQGMQSGLRTTTGEMVTSGME